MERTELFAAQLAQLADNSRLRRLVPRTGIDFSSNDYLALSRDPSIAQALAEAALRGVPAGSGGSRLLRGNAPEHEALEDKAAQFFGAEGALFMANGFGANMALLSTLPQQGDLIVADQLIHASAHEGIRMSRARHAFFAHNDPQACADAIAAWRTRGGSGRPWIVFETLYSMDGDIAPVDALAALADEHDGWLVIDEAHATGVFGPQGRGLAAHLEGRANVITLHTCGKALGVEGALVCGPRVMIDFLVNRARAFIFSTAPSPLIAVAVSAALDRIADGDDLRTDLTALIDHAAQALCTRFALPPPTSQIIPVILGEDARTMQVAGALQSAGFDVRGIRPPTVPTGTSRLRVCLTLNATTADVDALAGALGTAMEQADT